MLCNILKHFTDAIKEEGGSYANVSLNDLNKLSAEFVTKAGTRLAAKQKKVVEK